VMHSDAGISIEAETASADSIANYLNISNLPKQSLAYPQTYPQMHI
jgi:hypothetical protein